MRMDRSQRVANKWAELFCAPDTHEVIPEDREFVFGNGLHPLLNPACIGDGELFGTPCLQSGYRFLTGRPVDRFSLRRVISAAVLSPLPNNFIGDYGCNIFFLRS